MKKLFPLLLLLMFQAAKGQRITARIIDALNNKPLSYAIVLFHHQQRVTYTDVEGYFSLPKDSLPADDTVTIQFLGYQQLFIPVSTLHDNNEYKLIPKMQ